MPTPKNAESGGLRYDMGPNLPDPSALTTQQLLRENFWLRELIETRIDGMDKAIQLLQAFADRTPTTMDVQHQVLSLREVTTQRLNGIDASLSDRAEASLKQERDSKESVQAALTAAKNISELLSRSNEDRNAKTEASFTKQIDNITDNIRSSVKSLDDKIDDIKERITVIESKTSVSDPSSAIAIAELKASVARLSSTTDITSGKSAGAAWLWAIIVGVLGLIFGLGSFVGLLLKFVK